MRSVDESSVPTPQWKRSLGIGLSWLRIISDDKLFWYERWEVWTKVQFPHLSGRNHLELDLAGTETYQATGCLGHTWLPGDDSNWTQSVQEPWNFSHTFYPGGGTSDDLISTWVRPVALWPVATRPFTFLSSPWPPNTKRCLTTWHRLLL